MEWGLVESERNKNTKRDKSTEKIFYLMAIKIVAIQK